MKKAKQILSLLLALVLCAGLLPMGSTAAAVDDDNIHDIMDAVEQTEEFVNVDGASPAPDMDTVYVSTTDELRAAIQSDRTIILNPGVYDLDWEALWITEVDNLTIRGNGSVELVNNDRDDEIVSFWNCNNIIFENIKAGHGNSTNGCTRGVITIDGCTNVEINNCDIYGCGYEGIVSVSSEITVSNTTIRDCSERIMQVYGRALFTNCIFFGNGYDFSPYDICAAAIIIGDETDLSFVGCDFHDNKNPVFVGKWSNEYMTPSTCTTSGCTFKNNGWDDETDIGDETDKVIVDIPSDAYEYNGHWYKIYSA